MAGVRFTFTTARVAITAPTVMVPLQVRAIANHRALIEAWAVSFDGNSGTATPVDVDIETQSTDGTMTQLTAVKKNYNDDESIVTTGWHTSTVLPTVAYVIKRVSVHPQGGYEWTAPFGQEIVLRGSTTGDGIKIGIRCNAAANVNVTATFEMNE